MRTVMAGLVALALFSTSALAQVGHSRKVTDDEQGHHRRHEQPAPTQTVTVTGGGLDPEARRQIVEAVAEARQALQRLRDARNARCEMVKERSDLAAEQVEAKLERILLAVERREASVPVLVHPVVVTETDQTPQVEAPAFLLPEEVQRLSQAVAAESFAEDQLRVLRLGFTDIPIQAADAKELLGRFNFGEDKLKALQVMAPYLYDRQNAYQLLDAFTFSDDKAAAQRILSR